MIKLNEIAKREFVIANLGITDRDISLYFHCDKGYRWWFENTQRVADIINSGYWKPESVLKKASDKNSKNIKCIYFVIHKLDG